MSLSGLSTHCKLMTAVVAVLFVSNGNILAAKCPCDIYEAGGTPCVAAHSTVRALYSSYSGNLYQVRRLSDNKTKDIGVVGLGGIVNAAAQDSFLANNAKGTISIIYDQSNNANHLKSNCTGTWGPPDTEAVATDAPIKINGYKAYGVLTYGAFSPAAGTGYRNNVTKGVPTGNPAEGMYMVAGGKRYNQWCCFDYGNAESNGLCNGKATMECIYFGNSTQWGHGSGSGPWIMADMENGMVAGADYVDNNNTSITPTDFVSLALKGGGYKAAVENWYCMKAGNAQSGKLENKYAGKRPSGYYPMKLDGAIILGIGGDNSHTGIGTFFEGAMTKGCPSDTTEDAVQANIVAAKYGATTTSIYSPSIKPVSASTFKVKFDQATAKATISYALQEQHRVSVNIVDQQGKNIKELANDVLNAGRHTFDWNTKGVPAGVYVCRVTVEGIENTAGRIIVRR